MSGEMEKILGTYGNKNYIIGKDGAFLGSDKTKEQKQAVKFAKSIASLYGTIQNSNDVESIRKAISKMKAYLDEIKKASKVSTSEVTADALEKSNDVIRKTNLLLVSACAKQISVLCETLKNRGMNLAQIKAIQSRIFELMSKVEEIKGELGEIDLQSIESEVSKAKTAVENSGQIIKNKVAAREIDFMLGNSEEKAKRYHATEEARSAATRSKERSMYNHDIE